MSWTNTLLNAFSTVAPIAGTAAKIASPNYDLIPGITVNNRPGQTDVNPFNSRPANFTPIQSTPVSNFTNRTGTGGSFGTAVNSSLGGSFGGGSSGGGGGAVAQGPQYDPNAIALFDQGIGQINSGIGRLDNQQNIGFGNISSAYNNSLNQLMEGRGIAQRDYDTNKVDTTQSNIAARSNIDASVGRQANALQRLLGSRGAGASSAARQAAPYAAALQGTQQRAQVGDAYAQNMRQLDTSWGDYDRSWNNSRKDLDNQKFQNENNLKAQIAERRSSLLGNLAQLQAQKNLALGGTGATSVAAAQPYLNQANELNTQVDELGRQWANPVMQAQQARFSAPELAKYNYNPTAGAQVGNTGAMSDTISPYLSSLLKNRERKI